MDPIYEAYQGTINEGTFEKHWDTVARELIAQHYDYSWKGNEAEAIIQWLSDTNMEYKRLPRNTQEKVNAYIRKNFKG